MKFALVKYEVCFVFWREQGNAAGEAEIVMSISATFDQLLRGSRVICPASGIDGIRDVAIRNGKIAAVQARHAADQRQRGDRRRPGQAGIAGPDRYARRMSISMSPAASA